MRWTIEDKECAKLLSEEGLTPIQVSAETGIPSGTIAYWKRGWGISSKNNYKDLYVGTVEEVQQRLIKIMQDAKEVSYAIFNSKDSGTPSATVYRKYFGSWEAAKTAAGISTNSNMHKDKLTKVYLLEFDGFYKVGITQQTFNERFGGRYPAYEVLMFIETTLEEAKSIEKQWLNNVKHLKYVPSNFPAEGRGFTECFKICT